MTRKRRYLISAAVVAASVGIALGVFAMLPPRPGVTRANFDRIEVGMTQATVQEILGASPHVVYEFKSHERTELILRWTEHGESARIYFLSDAVAEKEWFPGPTEGIIAKLRRWLHLPAE